MYRYIRLNVVFAAAAPHAARGVRLIDARAGPLETALPHCAAMARTGWMQFDDRCARASRSSCIRLPIARAMSALFHAFWSWVCT